MTQVAPGNYTCSYSNFPGIFKGTRARMAGGIWYCNGTASAPVPGNYQFSFGGTFRWSNGYYTVQWEKD